MDGFLCVCVTVQRLEGVFLSQMRIFPLPITTARIPYCFFFIPLFASFFLALSPTRSLTCTGARTRGAVQE